jgi:outer membrane protein assembly factor BamB
VISRNAAGQRYVAFESLADDLVDTSAPGISEIFRFQLGSGGVPVDLVSLPNSGLPDPIANGGSFNPAISGPGLCIVYESEATNLVSDKASDDLNGARDVFRWQDPRNTILLSHRAGAPSSGTGAESGDGASTEPSIDDVCERFAFKSAAKNLAPGQFDGNAGTDVFHAGNSGDAVLVSHRDGAPNVTGGDTSDSPILSRNGQWVAYASKANDLSPGQIDTGAPSSDVFVHDVMLGGNSLASHTAADPKTVGNGESFAPEISFSGLYVAYESDAKDLDPNQNDGNGARDLFLYNTRWNSSIVASPRYASIAITGESQSVSPALSGQGYAAAFTGLSADHVADDTETGGIEDVFLFKASSFLPFLSVRSTDSQNVLEWITPPVNYVSMQLLVTGVSPCNSMPFSDPGWSPLAAPIPPANTSALFVDPNAYPAGATRCYGVFVERDAGPIQPGDFPARTTTALTLEDPTGAVKWANNVAGTTALAQVGIGTQNLVAVANEGGVYGLTRGPTGGFWPGGHWPFRATLSPIQGRPPVLPLSVRGSTRTTFVGSQDGRVYAYDADRGGRAGGALWYTSPRLADRVQAGVAGMFTFFGGVGDHLVIGTRPASGAAQFFALDPATGLPRPGSPFVGPIGLINTTASVDYNISQVYFASLEFTGVDPSLWCLGLTATGLGPACWPPQTLPAGISGGPVQRSGRVYVGDDSGRVWAFDATSGLPAWPGPFTSCGGGAAIKSFVLADRLGTAQDLYYATSSGLCAITDTGPAPVSKWSIGTGTIPGPSAPILARIGGVAYLYVGSSNGNLYQIDTADPFAAGGIKSVLLRTGATIGPPAFDVSDNMLYSGSDAGPFYAVQAPLP